MTVHIALLRGINVGGKNRVAMKAVAELFEAAGAQDVTTYIQSGNVIFRATEVRAPRIAGTVTAEISRRHGLAVPIVVRTANELFRVAARHPFGDVATTAIYVAFLGTTPSRPAVATLDLQRSPPDVFIVRGSHIYLYLPGGVGRTKLTNAYFDAKLATTTTVRNWNTVLALRDLAGSR